MNNFKNWVTLTESIIVTDISGHGESTLSVVSPNLIREFNYQGEELYSTYFLAAYQARRVGYVTINSNPTHVGITKTSPIEKGKGVDIAFIKALTQHLGSAGLKPVHYKEGESSFAGIIKDLGVDDFDQSFKAAADKEAQPPQTPDISKGASNSQQISTSIKVSRASGSWSYFIKIHDGYQAQRTIDSLLVNMEKSLKPLMDSDLVEWYEIVDRMSGKRIKSVFSNAGQEKQKGWQNEEQVNVGYLKFLAQSMLKPYPHAQKLTMDRINQVGVRVSGGGENPAVKIQPANAKVPIDTLMKYVNTRYAEDHVILFFLQLLKLNNDHLYEVFDKVAQEKNAPVLLWQVDQLLNNRTGHMFDNVGLYLWDGVKIFENQDILRELIPNEFNKFRTEYEEAVNAFVSGGQLEPREIKNLKLLSQYIDIEHVRELDRLHGEITKREEDDNKKRIEERERQKLIIHENTTKYLVLNKGVNSWKDVPDKYVDRDGSVYEGEFCSQEIVDQEDVFYDAHEKAQEAAYENAEERKSTSYGQDTDDVSEDIESYADDFINTTEADIPEDMSDEDLFALIKTKYYKEFIKWRKKELEDEEKEDSWKYEPEPDEQDIWKFQEELSVEVAFDEYGLIILINGDDGLTVELNSKFESNLMPILKKSLEITVREKDKEFDEPIMKWGKRITFSYRDKDRDNVTTVHHLLTAM